MTTMCTSIMIKYKSRKKVKDTQAVQGDDGYGTIQIGK